MSHPPPIRGIFDSPQQNRARSAILEGYTNLSLNAHLSARTHDMARLAILGSAAAVSDAEHDYTHFLLVGEENTVLVDCGSNPLGKIRNLGIDDEKIQDIILTHFHPDHVSGVPNML